MTGIRFRCGELGSGICLSVMKEGCSLTIKGSASIPRGHDEILVLRSGDIERPILGAKDLAGCIEINSESEALEYLRFFSSSWTVQLFESKKLEVFKSKNPKCPGICVPPTSWDRLDLPGPLVSRNGDTFEVTRTIIKPIPYPYDVTVFRVVERITHTGGVVEVSSAPIEVPSEIRWSLGFPGYY